MTRQEVGVRELSARFDEYLGAVRAGTTLIVTDRGEPIAELRPLQGDLEQKLARLRAAGVIGGGAGRLKPSEPVRIPGVSLSDAILEDREDRF